MFKISTAVFTIISKNYLAFARTLLSSVRVHHPEWDQFVLLVDEVDGDFDPKTEPFEIKYLTELNLPDFKKFVFRYSILELNTAVKPWMFSWLFNNKEYDKVVYLDPDIYVYDRLKEVDELLNSGNLMVLTPHLTGVLDDDKKPSELDILKAGTYNLGFLAVSRHPDTNRFLNWWKSKLEYDCVVDFAKGLFVDQKWMDLVPGMFSGVTILRHPGYNVSYWNLKHRTVKEKNGEFYVNGERLVFFHFSGVNPNNPSSLSKHQDRFNLKNIGAASVLVQRYAAEVLRNGHELCRNWEYFYSRFHNKIKIYDSLRVAYRTQVHLQNVCGEDPFQCSEIFLHNQARSVDLNTSLPLVTNIMETIWRSRPDLQNAFPDLWGRDRTAFCQWFIDSAEREYGFTVEYTDPVKKSLSNLRSENKEVKNKWDFGQGELKVVITKLLYKIALKIKPVVGKMVSPANKEHLKKWLLQSAYSSTEINTLDQRDRSSVKTVQKEMVHEKGINLVGYARAEMGVGESCRSAARALEASNVPFGIINFEIGNLARMNDMSWVSKEIEKPRYNVNIFHINADQMPIVYVNLGKEVFEGRYNIGYWHWELPDFPDEWKDSFKLVNEIWVPSRFIVDSISAKSPVPVVRIPHSIELRCPEGVGREQFGLPKTPFLFLSMYDTHSFQARKNPNAVIDAFKKAFDSVDNNVGLVIKVNNSRSNPQEIELLLERIKGYSNIYLIQETLSREHVNALLNVTDCFVSLHRSEGFGLGLAEAMFLGKPVIGTNWSANVDFMNSKNSCVVDYQLVRLGADYGPYKSYQVWADPDIEHAAHFMKKLTSDQQYYKQIALKGQETIRTDYSPKAVGEMAKKRLMQLGLL